MNDMLEHAIRYCQDLNWSIIPIPRGQKQARIRWQCYQTERPTVEQVKSWFGYDSNLAVVLGDVSGGLACRDFDAMSEYEQWQGRFASLARELPTVETNRGRHVYFRGDLTGIKKISNGELRGSRGYCLLPPSIHPSGTVYKWLVLPTSKNLKKLDPQEAGFLSGVTDEADVTDETEDTDELRQCEMGSGKVHGLLEKHKISIEQAIKETLPRDQGQRNRAIFEFARYLQAVPELKAIQADHYLPYVQRWHQAALPNIGTKEFEETFIDFVVGWHHVKVPKGASVMEMVIQKAKEKPIHDFDTPQLNLLAGICRELQVFHQGSPFFLSARTAGGLLNKDQMTAWRWLRFLEIQGWIKTVKKGNEFKANRYRYLR